MMDSLQEAELCLWQFLAGHRQTEIIETRWAIVLGCSDGRVAEYAAEIFNAGLIKKIVVTGGLGRLTRDQFNQTEARYFADILEQNGVPGHGILLEQQASNSLENIINAKALLPGSVTNTPISLICRNIFRPRINALMTTQWPDATWQILSPALDYSEYCQLNNPEQLARHMMVGEIERLLMYPEQGWQAKVHVPSEVMAAYQHLKSAGFDQHSIINTN